MTTIFKVCSCNGTMPLDAESGAKLGQVLDTNTLIVATELCRHQAGAFLSAVEGVDDVVVACTQEQVLFSELAQYKKSVAPLRFVNIRETGGWSAQASSSLPKMAALLAAAALPSPEPVPVVNYVSRGRTLLIGPAHSVLPWANQLAEQLEVSVLLTNDDLAAAEPSTEVDAQPFALNERNFDVFSGSQVLVSGWLGAFKISWQQENPIDPEVCTRCTACVSACPEGAIDWLYQIDMNRCVGHRDCVVACGSIGAIDFGRALRDRHGEFDLVLDLSATPLVRSHQLPQGYFWPGDKPARQAADVLKLSQFIGEFEKPKFFEYQASICTHSRNGKIGCNACVEVCSADAIAHDGDHIKVTPNLCVGCGACTTVCPSGAISYATPRPPEMGQRLKTLLEIYAQADGTEAALLVHSKNRGAELLLQLGRQARSHGKGLPARVIPLEVHHAASTGIDLWLTAVAYGATNIAVVTTAEDAPQYVTALQEQMRLAQTILTALGYGDTHFQLIQVEHAAELETAVHALVPGSVPQQPATFRVSGNKRNTLDFALSHLMQHAKQAVPEVIDLPVGAPYGKVNVNTERCTLCMACVGACPTSALMDGADLPQLRFIEKNCVQCGLCETTCPEDAISLTPRLLLTEQVSQAQVLNETQPFHCVRCQEPFATATMIESMLLKLSQHGAFAGNLERLKMCADCRVIDMMEGQPEARITQVRPPR